MILLRNDGKAWLLIMLISLHLVGCRPSEDVLEEGQQSPTRVQIDRAEIVERPTHQFRGSGTVMPPRGFDVISTIDAPVTFTRQAGESVRQGELLTQFSTTRLLQEQQWAENNLNQAQNSQDRNNWNQKLGQIKAKINACTIHAPFDLIVKSNFAVNGTQYNPNTILLKTVETGVYRVKVRLPRWCHEGFQNQQIVKAMIDGQSRICRYEFDSEQRDVFLTSVGVLVLSAGNQEKLSPAQQIAISIDSEETLYGCWLPITALNSDSQGNRFIFGLQEVAAAEKKAIWLVEKLYVKLVGFHASRVFVENPQLNNMQYVVDGTHRIVAGQSVCFEVADGLVDSSR